MDESGALARSSPRSLPRAVGKTEIRQPPLSTLNEQLAADERQHHGDRIAHVDAIDLDAEPRAQNDARDRSEEQRAQKPEVDVAEAHSGRDLRPA